MGIWNPNSGRMVESSPVSMRTCQCRVCGRRWQELEVAHTTICLDCEAKQEAEEMATQGDES